MNLPEIFSQILNITGSLNPKIILYLLLICFIGETVGIFIPYLFEATWLLIGYQLSQRILPPIDFVFLLLTSITGRELGAIILYQISRSGSAWLSKYKGRFRRKIEINSDFTVKLIKKIDTLSSPLTVALGRLLWLRVPLTVYLGARGRLKTLVLAVAFSSIVYDGTYAALGAIAGKTAKVEPMQLILYFLVVLSIINIVILAVRHLVQRLKRKHAPKATAASDNGASLAEPKDR